MAGFQLWVNLPAKNKMDDPWYKDIPADQIPVATTDQGVKIKVLAGQSHDVTGAVTRPHTHPLVLDVHLPANSSFTQLIPSQHNAFLVVYEGDAQLKGQSLKADHLVILNNDADKVTINSNTGAKLLLVAGQPLNEPIVQYGPFVMNTQAEIQQTIEDYKNGVLTS